MQKPRKPRGPGHGRYEPPDLKTQPGRLRWAREQKFGVDGAKLAAESLGYSYATWIHYENGTRGTKVFAQVAAHVGPRLGANPLWLITGHGSPKKDISEVEAIYQRLPAQLQPTALEQMQALERLGKKG